MDVSSKRQRICLDERIPVCFPRSSSWLSPRREGYFPNERTKTVEHLPGSNSHNNQRPICPQNPPRLPCHQPVLNLPHPPVRPASTSALS